MDNRYSDSSAERYKQEMMKLYKRSASINTDSQIMPDMNLGRCPEEIKENTKSAEINQRLIDEIYPEPDLSELNRNTPLSEDIADSMNSAPNSNSIGYIVANVRTGDEASPVVNAKVSVSAVISGEKTTIVSGMTDRNGTTQKFSLYVPDRIHSQNPVSDILPYSLFDVTVSAKGYFNAKSVDVPVFSGVTSVQNFNMIPVPVMTDPNSETITYYNSEPELSEIKER